ncbi:tRNA (N6-threonylcarbamoyladenosine(37)-N6)-methyltransferase TrmO [Candidatus Bathyarchaeota archaeon]|nr:tRNA (N6-threonylcarbamoyladenosine(37)-N6)-methyltransferase TrmO [Candidatus Bathyarchaeota archaeon]
MKRIILNPIGIVHTNFDDETVKKSTNGVEGEIEVFKEFNEGLEGIDGFSHLIVTAYLHKVSKEQRKVLKVRFRRLTKFGIKLEELPEVGVFCSDSPHRPVPVAITIVRLLKREGCILHVKNLDLFDKTPVLDIKPYTPDRIVEKLKLPEWYRELSRKVAKLTGVKKPCL